MNSVEYTNLQKVSENQRTTGFTLLEVLVVLVIFGVTAAIAAPSWARFQANRQVTLARDELRQGIQQAQATSIAQRRSWRFSLRDQDGSLVWAVHPSDQDWRTVEAWQALNPNVMLKQADTTLAQRDGVYYVRFGFRGDVKYRLSTVTLTSKGGLVQNRCVVISTLIGATRNGIGQLYPNRNGRYCY